MMRSMFSLIRREFAAYFQSPIAYVVLAVFLLVTGHLFALTLNQLTESGPRGVEFPMMILLGDERFWLVFLFIPPLLTMRLLAEERGSGTLEMLMTAPIRDWEVVLAKYIACYAFYIVLWLPTLLYLPILLNLQAVWDWHAWTLFSGMMVGGLGLLVILFFVALPLGMSFFNMFLMLLIGGTLYGVGCWMHYHKDAAHLVELTAKIDPFPILTSYIGVLLAGGMFLALGMFVSSLVRSQMVAALISLILSLIFIVTGFWRPEMDTASLTYRILLYFSVPLHFSKDFTRGLLDSREILFYLSTTIFFLFMTIRSLESRRWR